MANKNGEPSCSSNNTIDHVTVTPIMNPYILSKVFDYLRPIVLKKCRLICKTWNKEAHRTLSNRCHFKFQHSVLPSRMIQSSLTVIENSKYPQWLIKRVQISHGFTVTENLNFTTRLITFMENYGKYFTNLNFRPLKLLVMPTFLMEDTLFHRILTSWCPNIIHLEIGQAADLPHIGVSSDYIFPRLKIQSFSMKDWFDGSKENRKWLSALLNACPDLQSVRVATSGSRVSLLVSTIFENLVDYPNIAKNLQELTCTIFIEDQYQMEFLSQMRHLKRLKVKGEFTNIQTQRYNMTNGFVRMIHQHKLGVFPMSYFTTIKLTLTHLELIDLCYANEGKYGMIFKAGEEFPNLEFLKITASHLTEIVKIKLFNHCLEILKSNPHKNLKKLLLLNSYNEIWEIEGILALVDVFPNLEYLHLDFGAREKDDEWIDKRAKLPNVLSILSKHKFLKELVVGIYVEEKTELLYAIPCIGNFQSLQCLSIGLMNKREVGSAAKLIKEDEHYVRIKSSARVKYEFSELKLAENVPYGRKLRNIRFIDFKISKPTAEELQFLQTKNIKLEFWEWETLEQERKSWYAGI